MSSGNTTAHLHHSLDSALSQLSDPQFSSHKLVHRAFIIGGASLYKDTLLLPFSPSPTASFVDRILLTRIIQPAFEDCDTFMPDFEAIGKQQGDAAAWRQATHEELEAWIGSEVPRGDVENGVHYEFQMWVR